MEEYPPYDLQYEQNTVFHEYPSPKELDYYTMRDMDNIFITGATSGIGKACVIRFAKAGYKVSGFAIDAEERTKRFPSGGQITFHNMDVTDDDSVDNALRGIETPDVAILCAGMGIAGPAEGMPIELVKEQMDVNHFGVLRVCNHILPMMRKKGRGLLIVISSVAGRVPIPMQGHYSSSKFALEAFVETVRMEMKSYGVKAVLVEPGDLNTGFTDHRKVPNLARSPYADAAKKSIRKFEADERGGRKPDVVAEEIIKLVKHPNPPVRVVIGAEYKALMMLRRLLLDRTVEYILRRLYLS